MGYYIHYGNTIQKTQLDNVPAPVQRTKKWELLFVCVGLVIFISWASRKHLTVIPGNPEVTKKAAALLVNDLQQGDSAKEAFFNFCNLVIQNEIS